ncbi:MAG: Y4bD/Y4pK family protein, partial [Chloroflexota bacterium]|nr:Y4bD/Y4pK family protein [Chloroflexota bacterium]
ARSDALTTTPDGPDEGVTFTVTHPFHPLAGQQFTAVMQRVAYGEPRVFYLDPVTRQVRSLPLAWTDLAAPDPFRRVAADRAILRLTDLQALLALTRTLRATRGDGPA